MVYLGGCIDTINLNNAVVLLNYALFKIMSDTNLHVSYTVT